MSMLSLLDQISIARGRNPASESPRQRLKMWGWFALAVILYISTVLSVPYAHGWGERIDNPHFLTIISCRSQVRTEFPENSRPIPGVTYYELWKNKHGEHECKRTIADVVPRNLHSDPSDLSENANCSMAAMSFGPLWEQQNPGWIIVKVGCPKPVLNHNGEIIGYHAPPCPRNLKCVFNEQEI